MQLRFAGILREWTEQRTDRNIVPMWDLERTQIYTTSQKLIRKWSRIHCVGGARQAAATNQCVYQSMDQPAASKEIFWLCPIVSFLRLSRNCRWNSPASHAIFSVCTPEPCIGEPLSREPGHPQGWLQSSWVPSLCRWDTKQKADLGAVGILVFKLS